MAVSAWKGALAGGIACASLLAPGASAAVAATPAPVTATRLVPAQPSQAAPDQIGVLVFFDFSPASQALFARLADWAGGARQRIILDREPFIGPGPAPLARAFIVARTLGVTDSVLPGLFRLAKAAPSPTPDQTAALQTSIAKVFSAVGINAIEFRAAWNSPAANAGIVRARAMVARFQAAHAPLLIVNGLWKLTPRPGADAGDLVAALDRAITAVAVRMTIGR